MNTLRKVLIIFLFCLSILLAVGAPYFPSIIFKIIYSYDYHFQTIRFEKIIPSIHLCSFLLSAWGIALLYHQNDKGGQ